MEITEAERRHCVEEGNFADCADCRDANRWTLKTNECESVLKAIALEEEARAIETADALRDLQAAAKRLGYVVVPVEPTPEKLAEGVDVLLANFPALGSGVPYTTVARTAKWVYWQITGEGFNCGDMTQKAALIAADMETEQMTPTNINNLEAKRLRHRARKILDLQGLNWSQQEIADALDISRAMVRKTLDRLRATTGDSLYWKLSVCDGDHAVNTPCYDLECWLCNGNPRLKGIIL